MTTIELEAAIARLMQMLTEEKEKSNPTYRIRQEQAERIEELEAALRQQKDECERFHKPA